MWVVIGSRLTESSIEGLTCGRFYYSVSLVQVIGFLINTTLHVLSRESTLKVVPDITLLYQDKNRSPHYEPYYPSTSRSLLMTILKAKRIYSG